MATSRDWVSFWDSAHPIYVNARHLDAHYRKLADDVLEHLPIQGARVLDFGCGEALYAHEIAAHAGELHLCDAAPKLRARLKQRFAREAKIKVLSPQEIERMRPASLDLVIVNSVVQYLPRAELEHWLVTWRRKLRPGGQVVIGDVIGTRRSAFADAASLLGFARKEGFVLAALLGFVRTAFSPYRVLRRRLGLSVYREQEMLELLQEMGFDAERIQPNLGHNQTRMAFRATKTG